MHDAAAQAHAESTRDLWVAVDYGGVLTNPIADTVMTFCVRHQLTPEALMTSMRRAGDGSSTGMALLERGSITEEDFLSRVNSQLFPTGGRAITVEEFHRTWFSGRTANTSFLDALQSLCGPGIKLALVTNNVAEWREEWHRTLGTYIDMFDVIIDSSEVGVRKPEREIFDMLLSETGMTPSQTLFIDDDADNINAAAETGMNTHQFVDTSIALAALGEFLTEHADKRVEVTGR